MKRVLLFGGELSLRGTSLYTISLARELKLRGHKVAVLGPGGLFEGVLEDQRLPILRAPVRGTFWRDLLYLGAYCDLVRKFDPDVLHIQSQDHATMGSWIAERCDVPALLTVHAQIQERLWLPFGQPPHIIAVSEDVRQSLVTVGQFPRARIDVIPNGVSTNLSALEDVDEEKEPPEVPVVGTVNRIDRDRGIDILLLAARVVLDKGARAHFLIIGEGPAEKEVRALARKLELTPHVTFALPRTRVGGLFRPMDLYVSASHSEGHGIFLLSAMAQARPVISSGVGGVLTFIKDGENGLIVPKGDVQRLASKILYLLDSREDSLRLAREGFRTVRENFRLQVMVERTTSAYERAIQSDPIAEAAG